MLNEYSILCYLSHFSLVRWIVGGKLPFIYIIIFHFWFSGWTCLIFLYNYMDCHYSNLKVIHEFTRVTLIICQIITKTFTSHNTRGTVAGQLRAWSYGSWIYNYLCNHCLWPLKLWVRASFMMWYTRYNFMW
jgi:hypothetical protein